MSDHIPEPPMTAARAQNLARLYKWFAGELREQKHEGLAEQAERDARRWIDYASKQTPPG